jgi:hypothetical protein
MKKWWEKFQALNPPIRWLIYFCATLLLLSFLFAPTPKPINYQEVSFETTSDTRLYFHNVRSFYYHIDARSKSPMIIYRLKRQSPARDSTNLTFDIIRHPADDNAYIFVRPGSAFKQYDSLDVLFSEYSSSIIVPLMDIDRHYEVAAKVFSSFLKNGRVWLAYKGDTLNELYLDRAQKLDAEVALDDYFKLIKKY